MKKKLLLSIVAVSIFAASCKKDTVIEQPTNQNISDLVVPASFNWQTARDVKFNIGIHDTRFQNAIHVIRIYAGDPAAGGMMLAKGSATLVSSFKFMAEIPATVNEVYLTKTAPDGTVLTQKVILTSTDISLSVGSESVSQSMATTGLNKSYGLSATGTTFATETSPGCNLAGYREITENTTILLNENINITRPNLTVTFATGSKGNIIICGTGVKINHLNLTDGVSVIVNTGGSATFDDLKWEGNGTFKNFGTATISGYLNSSGSLYNAGPLSVKGLSILNGTVVNTSSSMTIDGKITMLGNGIFENTGKVTTEELNIGTSNKVISTGKITISGDLNNTGVVNTSGTFNIGGKLNTSANFTNSGTLTTSVSETNIKGTFNNSGTFTVGGGLFNINDATLFTNSGVITALNSKMNASGTLTNHGSITVKELDWNRGTLTNNCKLFVLSNFNSYAAVNNYSYIQVDDKSTLGKDFTLYNGSMFQTKNFIATWNKITGTGATSLFKVLNSAELQGQYNHLFAGNLNYCGPNAVPENFTGSATQSCDLYIAVTDCMPVGNGTAPTPLPKDTDGDGVCDADDDYPNDKTKVHRIESFNYANGGSTVAFEDSWPVKGDYDLNDVVMSYKYVVATDKDNKVVYVEGEYTLHATGGNFKNGAGVQFNLPAGSAKHFKSDDGAALESGQDSVVVTLFNDSRAEQTNWNTVPGQATSAVKKYAFSFDVTNGPLGIDFGIGTYNPFIWNNSNGYGRGYETHIRGKHATTLANKALFGTGDDNSNNGSLYSTNKNFPWAITVPYAPFQYPNEQTPITDAYLTFGAWAASGGTSYKTWYDLTTDSNINSANLYK